MKKIIFLFVFVILLFPVISKADSFTISSNALLDWGSFTITGVDVVWGQKYTKAKTANVPHVIVNGWSVPISNDSQIDNFTISSIATDSIMSSKVGFSYSKDQYNSDNDICTSITRFGRFQVEESGPVSFAINYKLESSRAIDPLFQPAFMSSGTSSWVHLSINSPGANTQTYLMLPGIAGIANDSQSKEGTLTVHGDFIKGVDYEFRIDISNGVNGYVSVPEPASILLLGFGLIGLAGIRRKFKKWKNA
ncbi:MAG: PEP-CTERM sorting domain-containing protein [Clostridiaceae bacterium]|nr:PEP-CTERM sorting domain-containing protein [Clostridiaceae bacterium]